LYRDTSTIFAFLTSFFYPHSLICDLPLALPVFYSCHALFRYTFIVQWDFYLGIVPVHALSLTQTTKRGGKEGKKEQIIRKYIISA
jgi:hypothetical protein